MEGNSELSARNEQVKKDREIAEDKESYRRAWKNLGGEIKEQQRQEKLKQIQATAEELGEVIENRFSDGKLGQREMIEDLGNVYTIADKQVGGFKNETPNRSWEIEIPEQVHFASVGNETIGMQKILLYRDSSGWGVSIKDDKRKWDVDADNWNRFARPLRTIIDTVRNPRPKD